MVPRIVQLCRDKDFFARHTRVFNAQANLFLITVCEGCIDMAISSKKSSLYRLTNLLGARLY